MTKHWTFREGTAFSICFLLIGLVLQLCIGPVKWSLAVWPINVILLLIYIIGLATMYALHKKVYLFRWMMQYTAAVPAIGTGAIATMVFGITNWEGTLSCWSFVLLYFWITSILGIASIERIVHFKWRNIPFLLNHLGLFIAIVCGTLGHADMKRLRMIAYEGMSDSRAFESETKIVEELDFSIRLNKFTLEEYPPHGDMPPMPRRFASDVTIVTKDGKTADATIEVNNPHEVSGWTIYQYSYDTAAGKDSQISIFELIRDPWLPVVYAGIYMLIAGAVLMILSRWKGKSLWTFALFVLAVMAVAYVFNEHEKTKELMPALQSPWFAPHVSIYMVCYTILGIATIIALLSLVSRLSSLTSPLSSLVSIGTSLMTIGMLFGALWAKEAWGHYWAWDPKETWAAATWFLYLTYIHLHEIRPRDSKRACLLLVFTYCCLQMCWWGINYLPSAQEKSIHTYDIT